jgi:glycosyltransferase involved in cell wall biosynthesis
MIRVLLVHAGNVPHYRVPIYSYLSSFLKQYGFDLIVVSDGIQKDNPHIISFQYKKQHLSLVSLTRFICNEKIDVIIDYMELKHLYLFPMYLIAKGILGRKMVYWGQGCDLLNAEAKIKNLAYAAEQAMCDAIILYADHLKKYVPGRFHKKIFIANNTLYLNYTGLPAGVTREKVLAEYDIKTKKNIICMGRLQKRKRLEILVTALDHMNRPDIGLILVGPDTDGILNKIEGDNIYKLGPIYGGKKFDLLAAADVYCLPGAVGLSIIDAFHCGLPFVTEDGDESAEIMYLKDGVNGFVVPRGNIQEMAQKLLLLLDDNELRERFSHAAKQEIKENGNIDKMCAGFRDALFYATKGLSA